MAYYYILSVGYLSLNKEDKFMKHWDFKSLEKLLEVQEIDLQIRAQENAIEEL